jgi:predicted RNase H-like HicB family nuclease
MGLTAKEAQARHYPIEIHYVPEEDGDGYFCAFHPDFGYSACSAAGKTPETAVRLLRAVKAEVILHYIATDRELPEVGPLPWGDKL